MKRITALVLATLVILGLFAGCSGSASESTTAATTAAATTAAATTAAAAETTAAETTAAAEETTAAAEETTAAATTADLEDVTLNLFWGGNGVQADTNEVFAYMNEQLADVLPNTSLNITILTFSEFVDKYYKALAAGEVIDLSWQGWKFNLNSEINDGNIIALDDYLSEYGQDIVAYYGDSVIDLHRYADNKLYFIPSYQGLLSGNYPLMLRKEVADLFTEEEVADICAKWQATDYDPSDEATRTIYDIEEEICRRAKEAGLLGAGVVGMTGFTNSTSGDTNWRYAYYTVGVYTHLNYGDETYTVDDNLVCEPQRTLYEYAAKWYDMGYIMNDIDTNGNYGWGSADDNACPVLGLTGVIGYEDPEAVLSEAFGRDIVLWQVGGPEQVWPGIATGHAIPFTAENPERAMMFLNLLFTDAGKDVYRTYCFGLEGKHWEYTGEDKDHVHILGGSGDPTADWAYGNPCWSIGTCENIFYTDFSSPDLYASYKAAEADAYAPRFATFAFDNTNVSIEETQISSLRGEYCSPLGAGTLGVNGWEAYYNEFCEKLIAAGMDSYKAEVQSQLNDWIASTGANWDR